MVVTHLVDLSKKGKYEYSFKLNAKKLFDALNVRSSDEFKHILVYNDQKKNPIDPVDYYYSVFYRSQTLLVVLHSQNKRKTYKYDELYNKDKATEVFFNELTINETIDTFDELIRENDRLNNTITIFIDKKHSYDNVAVVPLGNLPVLTNFTKYTHKPNHDRKLLFLYKNNLINIIQTSKFKGERFDDVQNKRYSSIEVYYRNDQSPIVIKLVYNTKSYYFRRIYDNRDDWTQVDESYDLNNLLDLIKKIEDGLKLAIIVYINEKIDYEDTIDDNDANYLVDRKDKIKVSKNAASSTKYEIYDHSLPKYSQGTLHNKVSQQKPQTSLTALKLFIANVEIKTSDEQASITDYLLYSRGEHKVHVYFYQGDSIPMMVEYKGAYYGPKSRNEYFIQWIEIKNLVSLTVGATDDKLLKELDKINHELNTLILTEVSAYGISVPNIVVNSLDTNRVDVHSTNYNASFNRYTHTTRNKFGSNKLVYRKVYGDEKVDLTIDFTATSVDVYYSKVDKDMSYPLVVECLNTDKFAYYILDPKTMKLVLCAPNVLNQKIDSNELNSVLNHQNFTFNGIIGIDLDKKVPYSCCESNSAGGLICLKTLSTMNNSRCCYIQTINNREGTQMDEDYTYIKVEGSINLVDCCYTSYKHTITNFKGGIKTSMDETSKRERNGKKGTKTMTDGDIIVKMFKAGNTEINLSDMADSIKSLSLRISEATVYFRKHDPRPLLLLFSNIGFRPKSISDYHEWIKVKDIKRDSSQNIDNAKVLSTLNKVRYELNPVYLTKLGEAIKGPIYTYPLQIYNNLNINVMIKPNDLKCYKSYLYRHENDNRSLGVIIVNKVQQSTLNLTYDSKKMMLFSVTVYYFLYDKKHEYPLLLDLLFHDCNGSRTDSHLYYKLFRRDMPDRWEEMRGMLQANQDIWNQIKSLSAIKGLASHYHPGLDSLPLDKVINFIGSDTIWNYIKDYASVKDVISKFLFEFELIKDADELDLIKTDIEKELYRIRTDLAVEYDKTPENLILATADNCKEDDPVDWVPIACGVGSTVLVGVGATYSIYNYPACFAILSRLL